MWIQDFPGSKINLEQKFKSFTKTVYLNVFIMVLLSSRNVLSVTLKFQMRDYNSSTLNFDKGKITTDIPQQIYSTMLQKNKDGVVLIETRKTEGLVGKKSETVCQDDEILVNSLGCFKKDEPSFNATRVPIVVGVVTSIVVAVLIIVSILMLSRK
ncbi:uncharacterized protein LOC111089283 [Limulus polyphemus]|uniref:Uncharacterized protein LOC111089283 n=1 Tax=Limulus polyphemus TaxID=6850 RepID=A0ABM1TMV1_LIMPO|nr:uncharacterized protein LOC111089283 [Limulus polyphemus]